MSLKWKMMYFHKYFRKSSNLYNEKFVNALLDQSYTVILAFRLNILFFRNCQESDSGQNSV